MSDTEGPRGTPSAPGEETLAPLAGEQGIPSVSAPRRAASSAKAVMAVLILGVGLVFAVYATIHQVVGGGKGNAENRKGPKAAATVTSGRTFDPHKPPELEAKSAQAGTVVPAIDTSSAEEPADPIGVRATDGRAPHGGEHVRSPLDAPALLSLASETDGRSGGTASEEAPESTESPGSPGQKLSSARASLDAYKQQLQGVLGNLQKMTSTGGGAATAPQALAAAASTPAAAALAGQLKLGGTGRVTAGRLGDMSLTLPRGTTFTCALKTKIVSEQSGLVSCQVLRNVYGADGRVLLVDRGSHLDGEYRSRVANGQARIFVVWSRLRTPAGVVVDLDSPATGPLGEAGVEGFVNNHWSERIGAALLLSLIEDAAKIATAEASNGTNTAIVLGNSADTTTNLSEKVLENTINIPPTITKLQGDVAGVYVAKDVDFSSVYELRTAAR